MIQTTFDRRVANDITALATRSRLIDTRFNFFLKLYKRSLGSVELIVFCFVFFAQVSQTAAWENCQEPRGKSPVDTGRRKKGGGETNYYYRMRNA